jgi:hypothetical protein
LIPPRPGAAAIAELIGRPRDILYTAPGPPCVGLEKLEVIRAAAMLAGAVFAALAAPALGEDEFPLVGTYTENHVCKGNGSDAGVSRVKITVRDIDSVFGLCTILSKKREGDTFAVHVECKGPGGSQMVGDVNFTLREDKAIDFSDQDQTYKAVLYKCPE